MLLGRRTLVLLLLLVAPAALGQESNATSATSMETGTELPASSTGDATSATSMETGTELPASTTEWVTFPPGDVLNDPWFRKIKFVFPDNETILQGLRNMWPYITPMSAVYDGQLTHWTSPDHEKLAAVALNPALHDNLYCFIISWPWWGSFSVQCVLGSSRMFTRAVEGSPLEMLRNSPIFAVTMAVIATAAILFGIVGNVLILISIKSRKELKTSTNMLLAGIAVADILNSLCTAFYEYPRSFLLRIMDRALGPVGCLVVYTLREMLQYAAVNHLVTLSIERYFAICWPMKQTLKFTPKKTIIALVLNWVVAAVQVIPYSVLYVGLQPTNHSAFSCHHNPKFDFKGAFYALFMYLILPVPILSFNYVSVIRTLLGSIKRAREMTGETSGQTRAEKARLRLVYLLVTLVVIYIITFLPYITHLAVVDINMVYILSELDRRKLTAMVIMVRGINSCTNVVAYAVISRQFRAAFRELLCGCCKKPSVGNSASTVPAETPAGRVVT